VKQIFILLLASVAFTPAARGEMPALSKDFQDYMQAHHYLAVAIESGGTNQQWIHAKINGHGVVLAIDTGCSRTLLTYQCARDLGLDIHDTGRLAGGLNGKMKGHVGIALIQSFQLSIGEINRTNTIEVEPKEASLGWGVDGLWGLDFLTLNAAVYPVAGHGLLLKPGPAPPVTISDFMTKFGFKAVPITNNGSIWVNGHINGAAMKFIVDTGAFVSDFRLESVRRALRANMYGTILPIAGIENKYRRPLNLSLPRWTLAASMFRTRAFWPRIRTRSTTTITTVLSVSICWAPIAR
jgi:predicted aspartyl protease